MNFHKLLEGVVRMQMFHNLIAIRNINRTVGKRNLAAIGYEQVEVRGDMTTPCNL